MGFSSHVTPGYLVATLAWCPQHYPMSQTTNFSPHAEAHTLPRSDGSCGKFSELNRVRKILRKPCVLYTKKRCPVNVPWMRQHVFSCFFQKLNGFCWHLGFGWFFPYFWALPNAMLWTGHQRERERERESCSWQLVALKFPTWCKKHSSFLN